MCTSHITTLRSQAESTSCVWGVHLSTHPCSLWKSTEHHQSNRWWQIYVGSKLKALRLETATAGRRRIDYNIRYCWGVQQEHHTVETLFFDFDQQILVMVVVHSPLRRYTCLCLLSLSCESTQQTTAGNVSLLLLCYINYCCYRHYH